MRKIKTTKKKEKKEKWEGEDEEEMLMKKIAKFMMLQMLIEILDCTGYLNLTSLQSLRTQVILFLYCFSEYLNLYFAFSVFFNKH